MSHLHIELCPETGICSIRKADGTKTDLMPDELEELRAAGDSEAVKKAVGEADEKFAATLTAEELAELASALQ